MTTVKSLTPTYPRISSHPSSRSHIIQIVAVSIVLLFLVIFVPVSTILNNNEANKKLQQVATVNGDPFSILSNGTPFDGILIMGNVTNVDVAGFNFKVHFNAYPWGTYSLQDNSTNYAYNRLASDVLLIVGGKQTAMKQGSIIPSFDIAIPIDVGQPNLYPFDKYKTYFDIASYRNSFFNQSVPLVAGIVGAVQSWTVALEIANAGGTSGIIIVDTFIERSWTTKFFSMIVVIIMWALSLSAFTLTITLWLRDRKVEPPTISITASLLFALPALRNSQPGAPVIGSSVDVAGFMWNMVLVAVSCLLLIINYITKYKRDKVRSDPPINGSSNTTLASEPHSTVVKVTGMQPTYSPQEHGFSPHRNVNTFT
ncbi:hypothetical protein BDV3_003947 [Batrachochytrium dendrobatidis]